MRQHVMGRDRQRPVIACQRLIEAVERLETIATVVERIGVVGPDRQRSFIARQRRSTIRSAISCRRR
jgi:hypothetical protein